MKKKEKMVILVLAIITIALIVVGVVIKNNKNTQTANNKPNKSNSSQNAEGKIQNLDEEHVITLEDGTRYSTSKALKKTKSFDGITITDIQLTEKENKTVLLGTLTNTTEIEKGGYYVNIVLEDNSGNSIATLRTYVDKLGAGESTQLNTQSTLDYADAYDFSIEL